MIVEVVTILPSSLVQLRLNIPVDNSSVEDRFSLDPANMPKKIAIDLPPAVAEHLEKLVAATGRSMDELIVEILDKGLQDY